IDNDKRGRSIQNIGPPAKMRRRLDAETDLGVQGQFSVGTGDAGTDLENIAARRKIGVTDPVSFAAQMPVLLEAVESVRIAVVLGGRVVQRREFEEHRVRRPGYFDFGHDLRVPVEVARFVADLDLGDDRRNEPAGTDDDRWIEAGQSSDVAEDELAV